MILVFVTFPKQYFTEEYGDELELTRNEWMAELAKKQAKLNRYKAMLGHKKWDMQDFSNSCYLVVLWVIKWIMFEYNFGHHQLTDFGHQK